MKPSILDRYERDIEAAIRASDAPRIMDLAHDLRRMAWSRWAAPRKRALVRRAGEQAARILGYRAGIAQHPLWSAAYIGPYGIRVQEIA